MRSSSETYEVVKTEEEWRKHLTPEQYQVLREHGTERAGTCALLHEKRAGHVQLRGVRPAAVQVHDRSSRAAPAGRAFSSRSRAADRDHRRSQLLHDAHRGALPPLRQPPRPRVRGRPAADRPALLHQRRRAQLRPRSPSSSVRLDPRAAGRFSCRRVAATSIRQLMRHPTRPDPGASPWCAAAGHFSRRRADASSSFRFSSSCCAARSSPPSWMNVTTAAARRCREMCRAPRHTSMTVPESLAEIHAIHHLAAADAGPVADPALGCRDPLPRVEHEQCRAGFAVRHRCARTARRPPTCRHTCGIRASASRRHHASQSSARTPGTRSAVRLTGRTGRAAPHVGQNSVPSNIRAKQAGS